MNSLVTLESGVLLPESSGSSCSFCPLAPPLSVFPALSHHMTVTRWWQVAIRSRRRRVWLPPPLQRITDWIGCIHGRGRGRQCAVHQKQFIDYFCMFDAGIFGFKRETSNFEHICFRLTAHTNYSGPGNKACTWFAEQPWNNTQQYQGCWEPSHVDPWTDVRFPTSPSNR